MAAVKHGPIPPLLPVLTLLLSTLLLSAPWPAAFGQSGAGAPAPHLELTLDDMWACGCTMSKRGERGAFQLRF